MSGLIICDWTTGKHVYREPVKPFESGRVLKIDRSGSVEWEKQEWEQIRCPSSDTSIRIKSDGKVLRFMGNIGRFAEKDNVTGVGVISCLERWATVLGKMGVPLFMFGTVQHRGHAFESGTTLSRIDLAGNFDVSDYQAWCQFLMLRPLGRKHPIMGKYGPTWGYESKRSNWWKAKIYDKTAEAAGLRNSRGGQTRARFEIQLGSEYLKREGLQYVSAWAGKGDKDMAQIIYGRFLNELMTEPASVEDWADIPVRLRHWAILWRDGVDIRTMVKRSSFYNIKSRLRAYGIDVSIPCNVVSLSKRVRSVDVVQVSAVRKVA